ncbi:MAG TPA: acryloyl-CoA reductase [Candidatus Limnocylindrales bacterium]|nr:acryloyl-CoA reductase [Candidatus Limnocylindrales bacterium]
MPALPETFRAYVVNRDGDRFERGLRSLGPGDLPEGDLEIRVGWSSVNYKDGLAATPDGKVARAYPLVPGIDLAGTVIRSAHPSFTPGSEVIAHGYDLGVSRHGGYAEYARVPAEWAVPLPRGLTAREAMAIGTAGFTAAMSVAELEARGLEPVNGPVLVTGATGGVGSTAIAILAELGYEVWAVSGKLDERPWLESLGAVGFLTREEVAAEGRPLESERWAAAVDSVGSAALPYLLRTLRRGGAVAACGNASGPALTTTVFPFILRGNALLGIDSAYIAIAKRRRIWERLATDLRPRALGERVTEVTLETLEPALDAILAAAARGRWIVRIAG